MSGKTYLETGGKEIKKIFFMAGEHRTGEIVNALHDNKPIYYDTVTNRHEIEIKKVFSYPGNRNVFDSTSENE